jgi:hypothetical protein
MINTLVTIGCVLALIALGIVAVCMFKAIRRDALEAEKEAESELEDWKR